MTVRVATWNVNSIVPRLPRVLDWLDRTAPDVLCLQELKNTTEAFPADEITARGYEVAAYGLGRWNGVAILSKIGLDDVARGLPGEPGFDGQAEARAIGATCGGIRLWSVYVPNGREPENPHYAYKLEWFEKLSDLVGDELQQARPFAVLGDFNVAPTDQDVWDISLFAESTHVTEPERAALKKLRDAGLSDVFPRPLKYDHPFTYWDYRGGNFPNNKGMRIDLVYGNEVFAKAVTDSYVDREARKGKGPSDHAPIVVDLELDLER
ncbi:exodeoxyribonuclease III [Amycolatopsis sp. NPDC059090]|uniref:exodeoxyribonuclease III n=1 Tax=unclassified Amycolatopsis TaxID=2618356 RepID=UPI00366A614D